MTIRRRAAPDRTGSDVRAAIDIGTNSIHMVVARVDPAGGFEVLTREKESVRLGHGPGEMSELAFDAIDRGIAALQRTPSFDCAGACAFGTMGDYKRFGQMLDDGRC